LENIIKLRIHPAFVQQATELASVEVYAPAFVLQPVKFIGKPATISRRKTAAILPEIVFHCA
jgi:hypothetical protein